VLRTPSTPREDAPGKRPCLTLYERYYISIKKNSLRRIITALCYIHNEAINTLCGKSTEIFNVKVGDTSSNHWALGS
jgi:hypothetical protein